MEVSFKRVQQITEQELQEWYEVEYEGKKYTSQTESYYGDDAETACEIPNHNYQDTLPVVVQKEKFANAEKFKEKLWNDKINNMLYGTDLYLRPTVYAEIVEKKRGWTINIGETSFERVELTQKKTKELMTTWHCDKGDICDVAAKKFIRFIETPYGNKVSFEAQEIYYDETNSRR